MTIGPWWRSNWHYWNLLSRRSFGFLWRHCLDLLPGLQEFWCWKLANNQSCENQSRDLPSGIWVGQNWIANCTKKWFQMGIQGFGSSSWRHWTWWLCPVFPMGLSKNLASLVLMCQYQSCLVFINERNEYSLKHWEMNLFENY